MPPRFLLLRIVIGLMCLGFAFFWGRSVSSRGKPARRGAGSMSWAIRTLVAAAALLWGSGTDLFALLFYAGAGFSWGAGFLLSRRPPKPAEDLTRQIFPEE